MRRFQNFILKCTWRNAVFAASLIACVIPAGCNVGPDYTRPETDANASGFVNRLDADKVLSYDAEEAWWLSFGDETTAELVKQALENNNDLLIAAARVLEAEALLKRSTGERLPEVSYSAGRSRSKISFVSPFGGRETFYNTTWSQGLEISYIVDFFGRLRRAERAARADLLATEFSRDALINSIIAQVVIVRIEIATNQRLLKIAQSDIRNWQQSLEIVERRYENGLVGPVDLRLARENYAAAKSLEPELAQEVELSRHILDVLLGRRPAAFPEISDTLPRKPGRKVPDTGLPAQLLDRRPDIKQAELELVAATERVGVSIAALYPDLTLTASGGYSADHFSDMTNKDAEVYSAVISLAAPLYQGGKLRADIAAARARVEQAAGNYSQVILTAMLEVEDALVREKKLNERIAFLEERFEEAKSAEQLAKERYFRGVEGILVVLETERRRRIAENQLTLAISAIWNARVDLFLALGGNWSLPKDENSKHVRSDGGNYNKENIVQNEKN